MATISKGEDVAAALDPGATLALDRPDLDHREALDHHVALDHPGHHQDGVVLPEEGGAAPGPA